MRLPRSLITVALIATFGVPAAAGQQASKFDDSLRESVERGCKGTKSVIVTTEPGARGTLRKFLVSHGRKVKGEFPALDAITLDLSCADLKALGKLREVKAISDNAPVEPHQLGSSGGGTVSAYSSKSVMSGINSMQSTSRLNEALSAQLLQGNLLATLGTTSSSILTAPPSVGIAVIDSGIAPGIDFGTRISAFYDFTLGDVRLASASDAYGHGSHVAGLAAGSYVGVATSARVIGLKVLNSQGEGTTENVIRAIEFAVANKDVLKINVINLSLGHPIYEPAATDPMVQAVEHASRAGIVVVVSAGNFGRNRTTGVVGYSGIASPGNSPSGISVGSVQTFDTVSRTDDRIAPYSSRGPSWYDGFAKPDISAPGDNLLSVASVGSTLRAVQEARGNKGNYMRLSGTSMAAGVVSGMAAVVLQNNYKLTPNALKMVLQYSSIPVKNDEGTYFDVLTQGAGSLNAAGAITLARAINGGAELGAKWLTSPVTPSTTIAGQLYTWSQRMVWGNYIARGAGVIEEQRPAWALNIVWGDGLDSDDNIVWGNLNDDNIVWGNFNDDNIVWGNFNDDNIVWGNNVVWGNALVGMNNDDNIVWGNQNDDNIVWGNLNDDNIVWGNLNDDNIVWGNSELLGSALKKLKKKFYGRKGGR